MEYSLALTFKTSQDAKVTLTIDNAKNDLTDEQVASIMDTIIEQNVFLTSKGNFIEKVSAVLTERKNTSYHI
ncbi:DUF2922 domain-containing protein [Clostridium sp. HCP1S3_B4]|uniref:DUF2922 domain-containing protein n=1 Tax=unclassified Clostridium TaxID=2614128 RepID=UPI003F8BDC62